MEMMYGFSGVFRRGSSVRGWLGEVWRRTA